jgi:KDO2-lipid IV(A) lauroyltransferase
METAFAWWGSEEKIKSLYRIEGLEHVERARRDNKAILLLSGHMSCTEIGARQLAFHVPFQAMYKPAKNKLFESVMLAKRSSFYHEMVPRKQSRRLLRNLKHKVPTWYAPDQNFGHDDTVFAPFFGVPAVTLTATARIAAGTDAVVIPFFPYRLPGTSGYRLVLGEPLKDFPSGNTVADASRINHVIEKAVRLAPDQYLWVHKRFRHRPPGEAPIY